MDTDYVESAAESVEEALTDADGEHVVATRSTVIPGATGEAIAPMVREQSHTAVHIPANPEFL